MQRQCLEGTLDRSMQTSPRASDAPRAAGRSVSRRAAIRLGTGGAVALTARGLAPTAAQEVPATFVLVPGAWAGSWIWRDIAAGLLASGAEVYATTATGMGDRVHLADPAIDLDTHVADVVNVLEYEDLSDVTLVGWSYSGLIITGVAERVPERLAQVVYIDATVPKDGETGWDAELYSEGARAADVASGVAAGIPGFFTFDPYREWIETMMPDPAAQEWLYGKFTPQSLATYSQPIVIGNPVAAALPRVFIFCTEGKGEADVDHTVRTRERVASDPNWRVVELADTHFVPINNPQLTIETLLSLV